MSRIVDGYHPERAFAALNELRSQLSKKGETDPDEDRQVDQFLIQAEKSLTTLELDTELKLDIEIANELLGADLEELLVEMDGIIPIPVEIAVLLRKRATV